MATQVSEYISVADRLAELGVRYPTGFALLPTNFETAKSISDLRQVSAAATVRKLLRSAGLPQDDLVDRSQRPPYVQHNAFELVLPTLFVSAALWSENPGFVSVALSLIANYATDFFKGMSGTNNVQLTIVIETTRTRTCQKISYTGPPDGMGTLAEVIQATHDE